MIVQIFHFRFNSIYWKFDFHSHHLKLLHHWETPVQMVWLYSTSNCSFSILFRPLFSLEAAVSVFASTSSSSMSLNNSLKTCGLRTPRPICRSTSRPTYRSTVGRHIDRSSTDMWVDLSTDSRPMCRSRCVGRHVDRHIGRYSQLPACGHLAITDTPLLRTAAIPGESYRRFTELNSRYYGLSLLRSYGHFIRSQCHNFIVFSLVIADTQQHLGIFAYISSLFFLLFGTVFVFFVKWGWQTCATPAVCPLCWYKPLLLFIQVFALTSMSLSDFPFLYEIKGGSLNISLSSRWPVLY